jgi:hypothetical protein
MVEQTDGSRPGCAKQIDFDESPEKLRKNVQVIKSVETRNRERNGISDRYFKVDFWDVLQKG